MSIFKKKKIEAVPVDPLTVLAAGIDSAYKAVLPPLSARSTVKASDFASCRAWLASPDESIYAAGFHHLSSVPCAALFFPASVLKDASGDPLSAMENLSSAWTALFPSGFEKTVSYAFSPAKNAVPATLWPFLELQVYQLKIAGQSAWLCIDKTLFEALSAGSGTTAPAAPETNLTLSVMRPKDFTAFESLIPRYLNAGKNAFSVELESVGFTEGQTANDGLKTPPGQKTALYLTSFELAPGTAGPGNPPVKYSMVYAFRTQSLQAQASGLDEEAFLNALAIALFQKSLKTYALTSKQLPSNPGVKKLTVEPDLSRSGKVLVIRANLIGHPFRVPLIVSGPALILIPLAQAWLEPGTAKRLSEKPAALALLLNMNILSARLGEILAPAELRKTSPSMLVSELLNHLSDGDYGLVLQNCLINTLGAKGLASLFYYTEPVTLEDGTEREKILPLGPLDTHRLFTHLQEVFREDFTDQCRNLHANPLEACLARNVDALNSLVTTLRYNRILSSPRLAWLVREYFQKIIREQFEEELKDLKNSGFPFSVLKTLTPIQAQKALSKLEDRDAALTILDWKEQKETIKPFMSSVRLVRIEEETVFLNRMYESWEISPEELLKAKKLLAQACADVKGEEEAEKAKKAALRKEG